MFTLNDDLSIYATRGDIVFFSVSAEQDGKPYKFQAGDVVRIKVYGKKNAEDVVLQKDFPVTDVCEKVEIFLSEEDTKIGEVISKPKDYWYEVELNPYDNPQTIIGYDEDGAKVFKLFPEGDDIPEFVPDPEDIAVMDDELDMTSTRPVQNQAIARAFQGLQAGYEATHKAVAEKFVTPQMYGAVGDGVADDTEAIQAAINSNDRVFIPDGTYMVSSPLVVDDTTYLFGGVNSIIKASAEMECIIKNSENVAFVNQNFSVKDITLEGNHLAQKGLFLYKISMEHYAAVDGLKVNNCTADGVHLNLCQTSSFYNIRVTGCGNGVLLQGCNNAKFYNLSACSNIGYGVKVDAVSGGSGGVSIFGIHAEQNGGDGLILNNVNSMASVFGGWLEENAGHGVYINKSMAYVTGLTVTGTGKNGNRWLYVDGDLATVENCFRARAAGDTSWVDAYVNGNSVVSNINNFQGIEVDRVDAREGYSNLLTNGNCEGTDGWLGSSTTITHQSKEKVHSGNSSLKAVGSANGASTHQVIDGLIVGNIYHFVGYVYSVDVPRLRVYLKYVNNADANTNKFYYDIPDEDWKTGSWVRVDFYFRAKDKSYDVNIQCVGGSGTYYLDDFYIKEYAPEAVSVQRIGNTNSYVYRFPVLADY